MHKLGHVGVWLVVVAALFASYFTSKLIQVRDSWTKKDVTARNQYRDLVPKIAELQDQLSALEGEKFRALDLWGNSWPPVQTTVQAQGALVIDMGTNNGITEKKVIYGFEVQPNNSVIYRGDFTVATANNAQAQLQPNWKVRAEDAASWKSGLWRWRNQMPSAYQQNFDKQLLLIGETEDALGDRRQSVDVQTRLLAQSQEQLKLREAELVGGEQLSKDPAVDVEFREGLVAAVEQVEEARNLALTKVDGLRRTLRGVQSKVDELQKLNVELTNKLPQPMKAEVTNTK
jgi:hypothetical protein